MVAALSTRAPWCKLAESFVLARHLEQPEFAVKTPKLLQFGQSLRVSYVDLLSALKGGARTQLSDDVLRRGVNPRLAIVDIERSAVTPDATSAGFDYPVASVNRADKRAPSNGDVRYLNGASILSEALTEPEKLDTDIGMVLDRSLSRLATKNVYRQYRTTFYSFANALAIAQTGDSSAPTEHQSPVTPADWARRPLRSLIPPMFNKGRPT